MSENNLVLLKGKDLRVSKNIFMIPLHVPPSRILISKNSQHAAIPLLMGNPLHMNVGMMTTHGKGQGGVQLWTIRCQTNETFIFNNHYQ